MARSNQWTEDEMIVVLDLYFKLTFGRLNKSTPEVIALAKLIGRTNNSVALRLVNYAACDPYIINSGRHGMSSGRNRCMPYWNKYSNNKEALFLKAEEIKAKLSHKSIEQYLSLTPEDFIGREREAIIKQRVNQSSFRTMVLENYENKCAITGIDIPELLVASHIIPWSANEDNRLNPANGICLSPLYDKMFDRGLIGIREDYTIQLSSELMANIGKEYYIQHIDSIKDKKLRLPIEHKPDLSFLEYHYNNIFSPHN